jgi:hypothetical protein
MLNHEEFSRIYQQAYLPEHLPDYVEAISGATTFLHGNYLCFIRKNHLIFNGFPLGENTGDVVGAYKTACEKFHRLALPLTALDSQVAYMVRRGQRELNVRLGTFDREHKRLIKDFIKTHDLNAAQIYIYKHIRHYLKHCTSARILEARRGDLLVAFTILDLGAAEYAFYLFNFRSRTINVPGTSDLLFKEMVELAQSEHKRAINLGLGIHSGIRRFKEKWGGVPFLPYCSAMLYRNDLDLGKLADKL